MSEFIYQQIDETSGIIVLDTRKTAKFEEICLEPIQRDRLIEKVVRF